MEDGTPALLMNYRFFRREVRRLFSFLVPTLNLSDILLVGILRSLRNRAHNVRADMLSVSG